jgi:hypothetical protein
MGGNPIQYFGRVKFYDYRKNHFGYIGDVFSEDGAFGSDVYMPKDELLDEPEKYWDGRLVTFLIDNNSKRIAGLRISLLEETDPLMVGALQCFPDEIKHNLLDKLVDKLDELSDDIISEVLKIAQGIEGKTAFKMMMALDSNYFIQNIDRAKEELSSFEFMALVEKITDKEKLILVANQWESEYNLDEADFAQLQIRNDIGIDETPKYAEYVLSNSERMNSYLDAIHEVFSEKEEKRKYWASFVSMFDSLIDKIADDIKLDFLKRFDESTIFSSVLNHWKFGHKNDGDFLVSHTTDMVLLDLFEKKDFKELEIAPFRLNLIKNIDRYQFKAQMRWVTCLEDPKLLQTVIKNQPISTLSETHKFIKNLSSLENIENYDVSKILEDSGKPHIDTILFFMGNNTLPSISQLNEFIKEIGGGVQFYLLQYCTSLYSEKKLSLDEMKRVLNKVLWTEINVLITKIFINNPNTDYDAMRIALNQIYKRNIANYTIDNLRISQLVKTCDGRAKPRGNIEYNWNMKTYAFDGGFGMEKGDWESGKPRGRYGSGIRRRRRVLGPPKDFFGDDGRGSSGDIFCEGRFWKEQSFYNKNRRQMTHAKYPVYWCRGETCWQPNNSVDEGLHYSSWGLPEILNALGLSIKQEFLALFAGWANRMNEIVSRLSCRVCGHKILPMAFDAQTLGFYAVPIFKCENQECDEFEITIRLTHCINGFCTGENNHIIDSRDCPQCSKNLLVCQDCFSCCEHHHDKKELCCPQCGGRTQRDKESYICNDCGHTTALDDHSPIRKFWSREMSGGKGVTRERGSYR